MMNLNKNSNKKYIKLLNKSNNFYLSNGEVITNIYYGEKEIYKLLPNVNDENDENNNENDEIIETSSYNVLYDSIYPVDVERYIFKTGKLDLIDVDSTKFDIVTALWIYLCWYQLFGYDGFFKEEFITEEDEVNGISEDKRVFFNFCFTEERRKFLIQYAPRILNNKIVIYKRNSNSKVDKIIEPLIKKLEKSKVLFNYSNGKKFEEIFNNKISNYDFLKNNIFVPKKYEYTDEKLHEYSFKIWIKETKITSKGDLSEVYIRLGNKNNGFKESNFKILLFNNYSYYIDKKSFEQNFQRENITPNIINDEQDIIININIRKYKLHSLFIGIVKLSGDIITEFLKFNNKNYEEEKIIQIA